MFDDCLIMAGGSGTRLWPASNSRKPKQFLPVTRNGGTETFFSLSLERALKVVSKNGRVIVIAGISHIPFVVAASSALSTADKKRLVLIPEPAAKNTAPAIACAAAFANKTSGKNRTMLVLTSDHIIAPLEAFEKDAAAAAHFAAENRLVVFGITPSKPETGYGYIEIGDQGSVVTAFREKPDRKTAEQFCTSKKHFWNSGMFAFNCCFLLEEFRRLAADVSRPFERLKAPDETAYVKKKGLRVLEAWAGLDKAYKKTKNVSFDYAVAEKCSPAVMVRASFDWIDVGSWDEYARLLSKNSSGSSAAELYTAETENCFVDSDIPVALAGVKDLIVVVRSGKDGSPPAVLVTQKGESQRVRDIVEKIKKSGKIEI